MNPISIFQPGMPIVEHPWLGDKTWFCSANTIFMGRTAMTALRFDLWMDRVESDLAQKRLAAAKKRRP